MRCNHCSISAATSSLFFLLITMWPLPGGTAHLHVRIAAPGHDTLITHVFRAGDPHLESDPVFGVRPSLVSSWPDSAEGRRELRFDFVLHRRETP